MVMELAKWFLRTGLQWIFGALLALAITAVERQYQPATAHPPVIWLSPARSR